MKGSGLTQAMHKIYGRTVGSNRVRNHEKWARKNNVKSPARFWCASLIAEKHCNQLNTANKKASFKTVA
eukprot:11860288-Ditylum_brightwellii.AAC.1